MLEQVVVIVQKIAHLWWCPHPDFAAVFHEPLNSLNQSTE